MAQLSLFYLLFRKNVEKLREFAALLSDIQSLCDSSAPASCTCGTQEVTSFDSIADILPCIGVNYDCQCDLGQVEEIDEDWEELVKNVENDDEIANEMWNL